MARELPRESRLFAGEILQGAPRIRPELEGHLKPLFVEKCALISDWVAAGRLPPIDPRHLIFSIWASTQHYADFESQVTLLMGEGEDPYPSAETYLEMVFRKLLTF